MQKGIYSIAKQNIRKFRTIYLIILINFNIIKLSKGGFDMSITATELKNNLSKYLLLASTEDIYITRNGKVVAKLSNPYQDRLDIAESLFGSVPATMTLEEAREERLSEI